MLGTMETHGEVVLEEVVDAGTASFSNEGTLLPEKPFGFGVSDRPIDPGPEPNE